MPLDPGKMAIARSIAFEARWLGVSTSWSGTSQNGNPHPFTPVEDHAEDQGDLPIMKGGMR
jgi:hypothetical protein